MLTCVLNAAEGQLNIILGQSEGLAPANGIICSQSFTTSAKGPIRGAEVLTPALRALFELTPYSLADVKRFACVNGPGSFTGIRLVLGTVAAIRRVTNAQNGSIDFMQALALSGQAILQNKLMEYNQGQMVVLTHARRNMVHSQVFSLSSQCIPTPKGPAILAMLEDVVRDIQAKDVNTFVFGSGYARNLEFFAKSLPPHVQALELENPTLEALWNLALAANYHDLDIEPLYVRPCDAVENLDYIATKQGMDPAFAHARLGELLKQNNF